MRPHHLLVDARQVRRLQRRPKRWPFGKMHPDVAELMHHREARLRSREEPDLNHRTVQGGGCPLHLPQLALQLVPALNGHSAPHRQSHRARQRLELDELRRRPPSRPRQIDAGEALRDRAAFGPERRRVVHDHASRFPAAGEQHGRHRIPRLDKRARKPDPVVVGRQPPPARRWASASCCGKCETWSAGEAQEVVVGVSAGGGAAGRVRPGWAVCNYRSRSGSWSGRGLRVVS